MKKRRQQLPVDHKDTIARVVEEFFDWKDVYGSQIEDGMVGAVIFADNLKGDVFVKWSLQALGVKTGDKAQYNDAAGNELPAQIVWVDKTGN